MKFGRKYKLTIQGNGEDAEAIVIEPPFTVEFTINRSVMASLNSMQIKIYNLSEKTRSKIFKDRYRNAGERTIVFQAGYSELSTCFVGDILYAYSERNGTDIITLIDALDGSVDTNTTKTFDTLEKGITKVELIKRLIRNFATLKEGKIGDIGGEFRRPVVLDGNTFLLLNKYTDNKAYIDQKIVHVLNNDEVIDGGVPLINSNTGLLGTPKRQDSYLTIDTIFEPRIIMGQVVEIQSDIQSQYDGQFKVIGVNHSGIISESSGGKCTSSFNLLVGSQLFGEFKKVS